MLCSGDWGCLQDTFIRIKKSLIYFGYTHIFEEKPIISYISYPYILDFHMWCIQRLLSGSLIVCLRQRCSEDFNFFYEKVYDCMEKISFKFYVLFYILMLWLFYGVCWDHFGVNYTRLHIEGTLGSRQTWWFEHMV